MKKITLLFAMLTFGLGFAQNGGDTCGTAVAATPGSYTATLITQGISGGEQGSNQPRDAAWFSFTPGADGTIDVSSCGSGIDTRLFIGSGTCGSLTTLASADDDCGTSEEILGFPVSSGVTYYIEWDDRWSSIAFDWSLSFTAGAICVSPNTINIDFVTNTTLDFSWNTPGAGTPVSYKWEIVPSGNGQGVGVVDSDTVAAPTTNDSSTLLTASTDYDIFIHSDCGGDGTDAWQGPFAFSTLSGVPPANDICSGATVETQETSIADAGSATAINGTLANAGNSNTPIEECNGFSGTDPTDDVWYSFTALTNDVNITVDANFDAIVTLYSGSCGSLVNEGCADNTVGSGVEEINATGLAHTTHYVRVDAFDGIPLDPTFTIKIWSTISLGENDFELNEFSYFPNPVEDKLYLKSQNNIENISIYNLLGQEVIRTAPNTGSVSVDMSSLQTGTYIAKVTINGVTETKRIIKR